MATKDSKIIGTYSLISTFSNWIVSLAANADQWAANVPASYKAGWSGVVFGNTNRFGNDTLKQNFNVIFTTSSSNIGLVSSATIRSDFEKYIDSITSDNVSSSHKINDLKILSNTVVTCTEVVWLLEHVMNFVLSKFVVVVDNLNQGAKIIMYKANNPVNKNAISNKVSTSLNITNNITKSGDIKTLLDNLNITLINKLRIESVKYNKSFTSSSSCSSSSSSSSSAFIAHIN